MKVQIHNEEYNTSSVVCLMSTEEAVSDASVKVGTSAIVAINMSSPLEAASMYGMASDAATMLAEQNPIAKIIHCHLHVNKRTLQAILREVEASIRSQYVRTALPNDDEVAHSYVAGIYSPDLFSEYLSTIFEMFEPSYILLNATRWKDALESLLDSYCRYFEIDQSQDPAFAEKMRGMFTNLAPDILKACEMSIAAATANVNVNVNSVIQGSSLCATDSTELETECDACAGTADGCIHCPNAVKETDDDK